jgi:hypothetical protein
MFTIKCYGCVLAAGVLAMCVQAQTQSASSQRATHAAVAAASSAPVESAAVGDESTAAKLPVRRVILYKTGVGYFEHLGRVQNDQSIRIDFTSGQLNDVLQSLTILDLNGGRIAGVNYNSEAPLSQRLGTLRLPLEETTDLSKFYGALRGAKLEVVSGKASITGRLLSVERKTRVSGGTTLEVDLATLVSDTGEVRSVELTPAVSVRLAEKDVSGEVSRYLGLLSSVRQQDIRRMTIDTTGTGERQLYVSYISETPVWKTTYRIVLPSKAGESPLLQGWAIVDNTVGEDWNNVELSLVAGAPQSFIQQLSQPFYARRPVIALPGSAQLTPQTHESAMVVGGSGKLTGDVEDPSGGDVQGAEVRVYGAAGNLVARANTDNDGSYEIGNLPSGKYRVEFAKPGFQTTSVRDVNVSGGEEQTQDVTLRVGSISESVTVQSQIQNLPLAGRNYTQIVQLAPGEAVLDAARQGMQSAAQGMELGDLFEYKLKDRVTIRKNESAMVPIVQEQVTAEKVSLWNPTFNSPRPLRALWFTNSSPLTLDGGNFSVLDKEAFAGEGLTDSIKPGERRLLSYAADIGVRVEAKTDYEPQRVTEVIIDRGLMTQVRELKQTTVYTVRNDDTSARTVVVEHGLRQGWNLASDGPQPDEMTSNLERFRVPVAAKTTATLEVRESQPSRYGYQITNVTDDEIKVFVQTGTINAQVEAALRTILAKKAHVAALAGEISKRADEIKHIFEDQDRLRENLKALKGTAEERVLTQRYTQQLADQETRLDVLKRESADLQTQRDQAQADLDKEIQTLALDVTM